MTPDQKLVSAAKSIAASHQLYPEIVCGICERESSWNPWSVRFEPAFERRYVHPALPDAPTTEELTRAMSFGLMQVMGQVARERGFTGKFLTELCVPEVGIEYGCRVLANKLAAADGNVERSLLLYNGGGNPGYPQEVLALAEKYRNA